MTNGGQLTKLTFQIGPESSKMRLDHFLFGTLTTMSKMYLREIVKAGGCQVNGFDANTGIKLRTDDFIEIEVDRSRGTAMRPENVPLEIVFEDKHLVVVNKPEGMLVHPTHRDKNGTLLNALTHYLNTESAEFVRPGLIHRLDKQTSGLLVVAKTAAAHRVLSDHFQRKLVEKRYLAWVSGRVEKDEGTIEEPIGRFAEHKVWKIKPDGKLSVTRYSVRERRRDRTLVELEPVTGRTNQLRIHCAYIGHPILGDLARGGQAFDRLCLHAFKIAFRHPATGQPLSLVCEPDESFDPTD